MFFKEELSRLCGDRKVNQPDHGDSPPGGSEVNLHCRLVRAICMVLNLVSALDGLHHSTDHVLCQIHEVIVIRVCLQSVQSWSDP